MVEYTHEMRWQKEGGELGKVEYYYNSYNKTLYAEDWEIVQDDWEAAFNEFVMKQNPNRGWQIIEIRIDLENK